MQEFFEFFRQVLIFLVTISLYWPLTIPLAALAYKVRHGATPIPLGTVAYWLRSTVAALGMVVIALSLTGFDATLTAADLPPGVVHLVIFALFVPLASWWMYTVFALEDFWEGLSTLLLFVFVPGIVLVLLHLAFDVKAPHFLDIYEWIKPLPPSVA
jgi:hypothetical protein